MRILYVVSGFGFGGAEKQLMEIARELKKRDHEVAIYTLTRHVARGEELAESGVSVFVDQKRVRFDMAVVTRLRSMLREWRPDIVHGFLFDGNFYSRLAALGTGIPVLNSERSDGYRLSRTQYFAHCLTRRWADGVVANTHAGAAFARQLFRLRADRMHVVWNGIRIEEIERRAALTTIDFRKEFFGDASVRLACLVGSIRPPKDYHLALDTAAKLVESDSAWRVLLVGDQPPLETRYYGKPPPEIDPYKAEVLAHHERLGMQDRIRICGVRTDIPAMLRQADVLYVSSAYEGFPNVVLEAMALGVPVASTEYSDIRRILPFPQQVAASREAAELARAVMWTYSQRLMIAPREREWVRREASMEKAATTLETVYQRYVEGGAPASAEKGREVPCAAPPRLEHER
jgi:glycosyltransferase involved in cell wall biosynthesis